jgi:hypothetical protein
VPVDDDGPAPERLHAPSVDVQVPLELRWPALAETVHVEDCGEVGEAVVPGLVERLPDGSLGELAVAAEHPDVEGETVQVPAREGHADRHREPLAERPGGDVDPGDDRRGMALEPGTEGAVGHKLVVADRADRLVQAVEKG